MRLTENLSEEANTKWPMGNSIRTAHIVSTTRSMIGFGEKPWDSVVYHTVNKTANRHRSEGPRPLSSADRFRRVLESWRARDPFVIVCACMYVTLCIIIIIIHRAV